MVRIPPLSGVYGGQDGSGEIERHPLSWTGAARPHGDRRSRGSSAAPARCGTPRLRKISLDPLSHIYHNIKPRRLSRQTPGTDEETDRRTARMAVFRMSHGTECETNGGTDHGSDEA